MTRVALTAEPGPDVTEVFDRDGDRWTRGPGGWLLETGGGPDDALTWDDLDDEFGPITRDTEATP